MTNYWVALSGGIDSVVLLHFLHQDFPEFKISAIHVNHQLVPEAKAFENHCKKLCKQLHIPLTIKKINITKKPGESLEAKAREARYNLFKKLLKKNDILFTAHHLDDQAETFLFQVLRGAGLRGASAMPPISALGKGYLVRPFLSFSREALLDYATHQQLTWVNDPSNFDTQFDRNYLRHHIFPLFKKRWPQATKTFSRFAQHCAEQEILIAQFSEEDLKICHGDYLNTLKISSLLKFSVTQQKNILRVFIEKNNFSLPSEKILKEILKLCAARHDKNPIVSWGNTQCRRYQSNLFLLNTNNDRDEKLTSEEMTWCKKNNIDLNTVKITFRKGGEKFKPHNSAHTRTLKNLFQEWKIPPWLRESIPLIYKNNQLIAIVGYAKSTH